MIAAEFRSGVSTVRIHDEYYETQTEHTIFCLSQIISDSYKRRQMESESADAAVAEVVANAIAKEEK